MAQDDFRESMMADFLDESGQLLDRLNENLLQLDQWVGALADTDDRQCDAGLLNEMFRSAHSIKGLSAMLGLTDINQLTHKIENVFDAARKGSLPVDGGIVQLMFQSLDRLGAMVGLLRDPDAPTVACDELVESIRVVLDAAGADKKQGSQAEMDRLMKTVAGAVVPPAPLPQTAVGEIATAAAERAGPPSVGNRPVTPAAVPPSAVASPADRGEVQDALPPELLAHVASAAPAGCPVLAGTAYFQENLALQGLKAELLLEKLSRLGDLCYFFPPPESLEQVDLVPCVQFGLATEASLQTVRTELHVVGVEPHPAGRRRRADALRARA